MSAENPQASEMAKNRALRELQEVIVSGRPADSCIGLIDRSFTTGEMLEGVEPDAFPQEIREMTFFGNGVRRGIELAVRKMCEAGLPEEELPLEGLRMIVYEVSMRSAALLETGYDGDPADLYFQEDGGNG